MLLFWGRCASAFGCWCSCVDLELAASMLSGQRDDRRAPRGRSASTSAGAAPCPLACPIHALSLACQPDLGERGPPPPLHSQPTHLVLQASRTLRWRSTSTRAGTTRSLPSQPTHLVLQTSRTRRGRGTSTRAGTTPTHLAPTGSADQPDAKWEEHLNQGWDRERAAAIASGVPELELQAPSEQRPHKVSYKLRVADPKVRTPWVVWCWVGAWGYRRAAPAPTSSAAFADPEGRTRFRSGGMEWSSMGTVAAARTRPATRCRRQLRGRAGGGGLCRWQSVSAWVAPFADALLPALMPQQH